MQTELPPPLVLYDVTRLVKRRRAPNPTGIDRIDLKFAVATFARFGADCLPVVRMGRYPVVLRAERELVVALLASLEAAWFRDDLPDEAVAERIDRLGITSGRGYGTRQVETDMSARHPAPAGEESPAQRALRRARRIAAIAFGRHRVGGRSGRIVYVTASHDGLARRDGVLDRLGCGRDLTVLAYLHDLMPLEVPRFSRADQVGVFATFVDQLVRHRTVFAANSRATAQALTAHLDAVAPGRFAAPVVVHPGVEVGGRTRRERTRPIPREANFVVLGTIEPRKNHRMLLEIWRRLAAEGGGPVPRLHIVGRRGWDFDEVVALLEGAPELAPHVVEESELDDRGVRERLVGATALLFPSFAEGFGLPLAEAAALGVPVIASDLPVFREIVTDGVTLLPPDDAAAWTAAIVAAANDPAGLATPQLVEELLDWPSRAAVFTDLVAEACR